MLDSNVSIKMTAVLTGVDFTKKGEFTNDSGETIKYGDSLKLKVTIAREVLKQGIPTKVSDNYVLQIPVETSIEEDVQHYNKLIGKLLSVDIPLKSDQIFKVGKPVIVKSDMPFKSNTVNQK